MTDRNQNTRPLVDWIADFDASDAEYDSGLLIPGETVMAEIQAAIDQLEAALAKADPREAVSRR
jgi:hypothetical protein